MRAAMNKLSYASQRSACCVHTLAAKALRADLHAQHRGLAITFGENPQLHGIPRHRFLIDGGAR
jgi:hypothetical protein